MSPHAKQPSLFWSLTMSDGEFVVSDFKKRLHSTRGKHGLRNEEKNATIRRNAKEKNMNRKG